MFSLKDPLKARARRKFAEALDKGDLKAVQKSLSHLPDRLREIDYLAYQNADFGNGSTKIPEAKYTNPVELAQKRGFTQALELMQQKGFTVPAEYLKPAKPRYGMDGPR